MCPMKYYNIIYLAWLTKKIHGGDLKIILSGDVYQIPSIETIEKRYDITKCKAIKQMCPTLIQLEYIENGNRFDTETYKMLKQFLLTQSLKGIHLIISFIQNIIYVFQIKLVNILIIYAIKQKKEIQ